MLATMSKKEKKQKKMNLKKLEAVLSRYGFATIRAAKEQAAADDELKEALIDAGINFDV